MSKNGKLWFATLALLGIFLYALLVIGDFALQKYISIANEQEVTKAEAIERTRIANEDIPQRTEAIKAGYKPLFYPETIDNYTPLRDLSIALSATPLAPQPLSNLYFCNEGYGLIKYKSDRFGFRNENALWDQKIDVVLFGDSFTHGACVSDGKTISDQFLNKLRVLNLGTYGNHAIHYAALEKIFIPAIKPKFAITIFYANDNDSDRGSRFYDAYFVHSEPYFNIKNDSLVLSSNIQNFYSQADVLIDKLLSGEESPDEFIKSYSKTGWFSKAFKYLKLPTLRAQLENLLKANGYLTTLSDSNILAIDTLHSECKINGCIPIVAYIPNSDFWRADLRSTHYVDSLAAYSNNKKIKFIDTSSVIKSAGDSAFANKGPHLSPYGYSLVAQELLKVVEKK